MVKRKYTNRFWISAIAILSFFTLSALADNNVKPKLIPQTESEYITSIYKKINFCKSGTLNPYTFELAYKGYQNLREAGKLNTQKQILTVCDFSLSANSYRLWIIDLEKNQVLQNTLVAHGQGSGEEFANSFSNKEGSHQSSIGFYSTGATYMGDHGLSLHLHGMDMGYNDAAYERYIVMHGAEYVSEKFITKNERLGRSWGCPAIPAEVSTEIIEQIKDGTCLFVYFPIKKYLASSYWINKTSQFLQKEIDEENFKLVTPSASLYRSNGISAD